MREAVITRWHRLLNAHSRLLGLDRLSSVYTPVKTIDTIYPQRGIVAGSTIPLPWPDGQMERVLWLCTAPGVELWLPTASQETDVYEAAEEKKIANSPVHRIEHRVVEGVRHPERRLPDGNWTESASDTFPARRA